MFTAQEGWLVRPSSHANLLAEQRRPIRLKGPSPRSSVKFPSCKSWPTHVHPGPPQLPSNQSHLSLPILCPVGNIKFVLLSFNSVQQFLIPKTWESFSSDTGFLIGVGSRSLAWSPDCEGDQSAFFWPPSAWVVPRLPHRHRQSVLLFRLLTCMVARAHFLPPGAVPSSRTCSLFRWLFGLSFSNKQTLKD